MDHSEPKTFMPHTFSVGESGQVSLVAGECVCGKVEFPRARRCSGCGAEEIAERRLAAGAVIHAFTQIHQARPGFTTPFWLAYIDFPGGVRVMGQLICNREPRVGAPVGVELGVLRRDDHGREVRGFRFRISEP